MSWPRLGWLCASRTTWRCLRHAFWERTMAIRVLRVEYYWPTLRTDCSSFVEKWLQCQKHGNLIHRLTEELHPMVSPWLFTIWRMDILGPFPTTPGQSKFLLAAIDYFTKWVEAKALANITTRAIQKFFWKNIITRFRISNTLVKKMVYNSQNESSTSS